MRGQKSIDTVVENRIHGKTQMPKLYQQCKTNWETEAKKKDSGILVMVSSERRDQLPRLMKRMSVFVMNS